MSRFYDIDDANATLAELGPILTTLVEQRAELVRLRDHVLANTRPSGGAGGAEGGRRRSPTTCASPACGCRA